MVGEVERADLDAHRGRRPVDDRAHQLVPVARQRRQLGDVVEEREFVEPAIHAATIRGWFVAQGLAGREGRYLIAQGDQVVVGRRVVAQLLLIGERLAQERPGDVEVAAQRVEAGEVVARVGGGT